MCSSAARVADLASLAIALMLALLASDAGNAFSFAHLFQVRFSVGSLTIAAMLFAAWKAVFWMSGMYEPRLNRTPGAFLWRVPMAMSFCAVVALAVFRFELHSFVEAARSAGVFWFAGMTLMFAVRMAYVTYDEYVRPSRREPRNLLVIGTGGRARSMTMALASHPEYRYQLTGFVDSDPQPGCAGVAPVLGGVSDLERLLMQQPIDEVLIALPVKSRFDEIQEVISICGRAGVTTQYNADFVNTTVAKHQTYDHATGSQVVEMVHDDHRLYLKEAFDRSAAAIGILLLAPVFAVVALAIRLESKGPVFFIQKRYGRNKRTFGMFKFRSMVVDAEAQMVNLEAKNENDGPMFKMRNDPRITRVGRLLRRTSLDELPQLLNVLFGHMSLVGPRPLPNRDVERFSELDATRRFSVKPGITGLWQVSGRSNTNFEQTIQLDLRYIDRWSLLLDTKILARTLSAVLRGSGAY